MDLLSFDAKKGKRVGPVVLTRDDMIEALQGHLVEAFLVGGAVNVSEESFATILYEIAGFGQFLDDIRDETIPASQKCFGSEEEARKWTEKSPEVRILMLLPEEVVFLAVEWEVLEVKQGKRLLGKDELWETMSNLHGSKFFQSYCVYRHLKENKWCVRSGLMFGCDYLIYCLGPQYYHSSAGVSVCNTINSLQLLTLTRILSHNKKSLILASCQPPEVVDRCLKYEDTKQALVEIVTLKTYFLERNVSRISNSPNELYELNL
ncbi:unnamed protein product [Caenorhabditis bovis]|uniref:tRNA-intron lyase n=1 Tax=Caenorhabditis bovis TaxID=2654633 RepID=A0A8S1ERT3_9PELO|nr:unnamed protein product [Caenorhabditis bovis]